VKNTTSATPQAMAMGQGSAIQKIGFRSSIRSRTVPPPSRQAGKESEAHDIELRPACRQCPVTAKIIAAA
jgi:hypothetical protein